LFSEIDYSSNFLPHGSEFHCFKAKRLVSSSLWELKADFRGLVPFVRSVNGEQQVATSVVVELAAQALAFITPTCEAQSHNSIWYVVSVRQCVLYKTHVPVERDFLLRVQCGIQTEAAIEVEGSLLVDEELVSRATVLIGL
jgi:hypothetical protein